VRLASSGSGVSASGRSARRIAANVAKLLELLHVTQDKF
jgi:hypothetical protein